MLRKVGTVLAALLLCVLPVVPAHAQDGSLTPSPSRAIPRSQDPEARAPLALLHVAPAQPRAQIVGRTSAVKRLTLSLVLPLRNRAALDARLRRVCDPQDPLYGQYLTPEEFTRQFGPDSSDVDAVAAFARAHGLTVEDVPAGGNACPRHGVGCLG